MCTNRNLANVRKNLAPCYFEYDFVSIFGSFHSSRARFGAPYFRSKLGRNRSIARLVMKKVTLKGKMYQTLDNSIIPAAIDGAIEAMRPSVKK